MQFFQKFAYTQHSVQWPTPVCTVDVSWGKFAVSEGVVFSHTLEYFKGKDLRIILARSVGQN